MTLIMFCQFCFLAEFCANMQVRYSIFGAHLMQHAKLLMQLCIKDHKNLFVALVNRKRVDGSTLRGKQAYRVIHQSVSVVLQCLLNAWLKELASGDQCRLTVEQSTLLRFTRATKRFS